VVSASKQKIILAPESRAIGDQRKYYDTFCKISVLSPRLVFSATGLAVEMDPSLPEDARFNVMEIARKSAGQYRFDPQWMESPYESVKEVAQIWGLEMSSRIRKGAPIKLQDWLPGQQGRTGDVFVRGVFAGIEDNKELKVAVATITYGKPRDGWIIAVARPIIEIKELRRDSTWIEPFGINNIADEYLHGKLRPVGKYLAESGRSDAKTRNSSMKKYRQS